MHTCDRWASHGRVPRLGLDAGLGLGLGGVPLELGVHRLSLYCTSVSSSSLLLMTPPLIRSRLAP